MSQTKFCPFCGVENDLSQTTCVGCEASLPVKLSAVQPAAARPRRQSRPGQMNFVDQAPILGSGSSWWGSLSPAIRSATLMLVVNGVLQSVSSSLPGLGFIVTAPFQVVSYFGQGLLVGKLAKEDDRYQNESFSRQGVHSVLWSTAFSMVLLFVLLLLLGAVTLGGIVVLLPLMLISQFGSIFLNLCFTTLGAWLYERTGGKNLLKYSLIIGLTSFFGVCALATALATALGVAGYSFFNS